ncbi:hypothetical protein V8F20_007836 [Naviculisporaceae sp. PSN 640]
MVLIHDIPGLEVTVWVQVDSKPAHAETVYETAEEYDCPAPDNHPKITDDGYTRTIEKYIEAKVKHEYYVQITRRGGEFKHDADNVHFILEIDGHLVGPGKTDRGWKKGPRCNWKQDIHTFYAQAVKDGKVTMYKSKFVEPTIDQSDEFNHTHVDPRNLDNIGTIKVHCYHAHPPATDNGDRSLTPMPPLEVPIIRERDIIGRSVDCCTMFDKHHSPDKLAKYKYIPLRYHDPGRRPFAVFVFHYRTKKGLIKEGIIKDVINEGVNEIRTERATTPAGAPSPETEIAQIVKGMSPDEIKRRFVEVLEKMNNDGTSADRFLSIFEQAATSPRGRCSTTSPGNSSEGPLERVSRDRSATLDFERSGTGVKRKRIEIDLTHLDD